MSPEHFRTEGKKVIDWIADYYENIEKYPVLSQVKPGEIKASLPENPPQIGESMDKMMSDIDQLIMPGRPWEQAIFPDQLILLPGAMDASV